MTLQPMANLIYRLQAVCMMCKGKGTITIEDVEHDCPQCLAIKGVFDDTK